MNLLRKLYDWTLEKSKDPRAPWFLAIISFLESSFFPIPPDIILIPMIIAKQVFDRMRNRHTFWGHGVSISYSLKLKRTRISDREIDLAIFLCKY